MAESKKPVRLTKLRVDEVSVVDKAANGKRFLILKRAPEAVPVEDSDDGGVRGWVKDAIKKAAGISGPDDGGSEMTAEEIKKAVQEAAEAALAPIMARVDKLEIDLGEEDPDGQEPVVKGDEPEPLSPELTEESITKLVTDAVAASIDPIVKRLETVENAAGARQSGTPEGAHQVRKADGSFSWEGSGLVL